MEFTKDELEVIELALYHRHEWLIRRLASIGFDCAHELRENKLVEDKIRKMISDGSN